MSFLYPWFWLAAVAFGVPVWLHLRARSETNVVRFSALQFLDDQPLAKRRLLWRPRNLLLLAVRLLALLLLIAAFSWPYVTRVDSVAAPVESRVYILDNTLSHQAGNGFQRARRQLVDVLTSLPPQTQVGIIELTDLPRLVADFGHSRAVAVSRLKELQPSFNRGSYLAAFRLANSLLSASLGTRKQIILLGDSQENQWSDDLRGPPFLQDVEVELPEVVSREAANLAVSQPQLHRTFVGDRALIDFMFKLHHQGSAASAQITISANGRQVVSRQLDLADEPGPMTLFARWEQNPAEWMRGFVEVSAEADELAADNRVVFSLAPLREGDLLLMCQSPFLRTALSPEVMRGRWASRAIRETALAAAVQAEEMADVLCIESRFLESPAARELVLNYVNAGKGVLLIVDRTSLIVDGFLRNFDIELAGEAELTSPVAFQHVFDQHPILYPFRSPEFGDLQQLRVSHYRRLTSASALPLIYADTGDTLLWEATESQGVLLVTAFALERAETNWPTDPTFVPFLDLCLQHARGTKEVATDFTPGSTFVWDVRGAGEPQQLSLRAASGKLWQVPVVDGKAEVLLDTAPGLVEVYFDDRPQVEHMLNVNVAPEESLLKYKPAADTVALWTLPTTEKQLTPPRAATDIELAQHEILNQQHWWWLALCALTALLVETAWTSVRKTDS